MNARTDEAALSLPEAAAAALTVGFGNLQQFEFLQRAARVLTESTLVPVMYQRWVPESRKKGAPLVENPNALPNAMIALNMASRMRVDALTVMQNLNIIEGRPSWASTFVIAQINSCGRFSTLRFEVTDQGEKEVTYAVGVWEDTPQGSRKKYVNKTTTVRNLSCVAVCTELATGATVRSPTVDVEMAVKEGWYGRDGSKWQTMPELMLHYRCGAFFGRIYASDLLMGLQTAEELRDMGLLEPQGDGTYAPADDLPQHQPQQQARSMRPQSKSASQAAQAPASAPASPKAEAPSPTPAPAPNAGQPPAAAPVSDAAPEGSPQATQQQAGAPATADNGVPCSDGSLKYILQTAKRKRADLKAIFAHERLPFLADKTDEQVHQMVETCDHTPLKGMTETQFAAVRSLLAR